MKEDIEDLLKNYFASQVFQKKTPPMPILHKTTKKKLRWDSLFMAACVLGCFIVIALPSTYDNAIRKSHIPMNQYEAFKEDIPRVIFEASIYFQEKNYKRSQK